MNYRVIASIALFTAFILLGMFIVCIIESRHTGITTGYTGEDGKIISYSFFAELRERICDAGFAGIMAGVIVFVAAAGITVMLLTNGAG